MKESEKKAGVAEEEKEEEEEFFKEPPKPEKPKTQEEIQKEEQDKLKLFSEFVAAEAEASEPIIKKEKPKEQPLRFKYFENDGEETNLVDKMTDSILSGASRSLNKNRKELKYESVEPEVGVTALEPVDYSKAQLDIEKLIEPLSLVENPAEEEEKNEAYLKEAEEVELTVV